MDRRNFIKNTFLTAAGALVGISAAKAALDAKQSGGKTMKILVITGSPRKNGNSNTLVDYFIKGAKDSGHNVVRFDSAFKMYTPVLPATSAE